MRPVHEVSLVGLLTIMALSGCIAPEDLQSGSSWDSASSSSDWEDDACDDQAASDADGDGDNNTTDDNGTDQVDPADAYSDAAPRYHNVIDGDEYSTRSIYVPLGADRLRVALVHDSDGDIFFQVSDPLWRTMARESADGQKYMMEDEWVVIDDPLPGTYRLIIDLDGESAYTVGFYIDD